MVTFTTETLGTGPVFSGEAIDHGGDQRQHAATERRRQARKRAQALLVKAVMHCRSPSCPTTSRKTMTSPPRQYNGVDVMRASEKIDHGYKSHECATRARFCTTWLRRSRLLACEEAPNDPLEKGTDLWKAELACARGLTGKVEFTEDGDRVLGPPANVALYICSTCLTLIPRSASSGTFKTKVRTPGGSTRWCARRAA